MATVLRSESGRVISQTRLLGLSAKLAPHLAKMVSPEGVVKQFVLVDGPEEVPLEQGDVVGQLLGTQNFQVDVHALGGAFLLLQLRLRSEMGQR